MLPTTAVGPATACSALTRHLDVVPGERPLRGWVSKGPCGGSGALLAVYAFDDSDASAAQLRGHATLLKVLNDEGLQLGVLLAGAAREPGEPFDFAVVVLDKKTFGIPR